MAAEPPHPSVDLYLFTFGYNSIDSDLLRFSFCWHVPLNRSWHSQRDRQCVEMARARARVRLSLSSAKFLGTVRPYLGSLPASSFVVILLLPPPRSLICACIVLQLGQLRRGRFSSHLARSTVVRKLSESSRHDGSPSIRGIEGKLISVVGTLLSMHLGM